MTYTERFGPRWFGDNTSYAFFVHSIKDHRGHEGARLG